jgi:hypothetical protein
VGVVVEEGFYVVEGFSDIYRPLLLLPRVLRARKATDR